MSWNKEGQVPILMLFVVTIVLVIVALMSFVTFSRDFGDNSALTSKAIAKGQFGENYIIESLKAISLAVIKGNKSNDLQISFMSYALSFDRQVNDPANNLFKQIKDGKFGFEKIGEKYKLNVTGLFVQAESGANRITRKFDLCMLFDNNGNYIKELINQDDYAKYCADEK